MRTTTLQFWLAISVTIVFLLPLATLFGPTSGIANQTVFPIESLPLLATVVVSAAAAVAALLIGGLFAVAFRLGALPGGPLASTILFMAFACPATVWTLGQVYCYGAGGLIERWIGAAWRSLLALNHAHYLSATMVLAEIHAPLAFLILARGMDRLSESGLESAQFQLNGWRLGKWLIRALRPEICSALLLVFALCAGNFSVPHVLQCRLYTIEIYLRAANYLDLFGAAWVALPLLLITLLATLALGFCQHAANGPPRVASHCRVALPLNRVQRPIAALIILYLFITTLLPLAALVAECRSIEHFLAATRDASPEIENTLYIAAAVALIGCATGLITGQPLFSSHRPFFAGLPLLLLGIPPLLIGVAFASFFARRWPIDFSVIGDTSWLVILGLSCRAWPFATQIFVVGRRRLAADWFAAAELAQISTCRRWRWITVPLLRNQFATSILVAFVLAAGDVEIAQMLSAPGCGTLSLRLFSYLHFGPAYVAANLALLLLLVTAVPVWVYFVITQRHPTAI